MIVFEKPVVFADFETTGTDVNKDRIVEMSFAKWYPNGEKETEVKTYRVNPGIPIPESATKVHGISDEDVKDKPPFSRYANGIIEFIKGCDLGGYNSNSFDFPLLFAELSRCNIVWDHNIHNFIDACNIFKIKEERTLSAAVKFYTGEEMLNAHSAEYDILKTVSVFEAQLKRYFSDEEKVMSIEELEVFCNYGKRRLDMAGLFVLEEDGIVRFGFGKHKGQSISEVDWSYFKWIIFTSDFAPDTKKLAKQYADAK